MTYSRHYTKDRQRRETLIKEIGYGEIIKTAIVDDDKRGAKILELSNTGIINIINQKTNVLITKLIATPSQLLNFYETRKEIPRELKDITFKHQQLGYNWI